MDELKKEFDVGAENNVKSKKKKKWSKDDCFKPTAELKEPDPLFDIHYNPATPRKEPPDFVIN